MRTPRRVIGSCAPHARSPSSRPIDSSMRAASCDVLGLAAVRRAGERELFAPPAARVEAARLDEGKELERLRAGAPDGEVRRVAGSCRGSRRRHSRRLRARDGAIRSSRRAWRLHPGHTDSLTALPPEVAAACVTATKNSNQHDRFAEQRAPRADNSRMPGSSAASSVAPIGSPSSVRLTTNAGAIFHRPVHPRVSRAASDRSRARRRSRARAAAGATTASAPRSRSRAASRSTRRRRSRRTATDRAAVARADP